MYYQTRIVIRSHRTEWMLTGLWIAGLLGGAVYALRFAQAWTGMLSQAVRCPVRWSGALSVTLFPLIVSLAAVLILGKNVIWMLCPIRSFLLGMMLGVVGICWGRQAPVMAVLLLFSLLLSSGVLLMMWQRMLCGDVRACAMDSAVCAGVLVLIAAADTWIVSPFLVEVINF